MQRRKNDDPRAVGTAVGGSRLPSGSGVALPTPQAAVVNNVQRLKPKGQQLRDVRTTRSLVEMLEPNSTIPWNAARTGRPRLWTAEDRGRGPQV